MGRPMIPPVERACARCGNPFMAKRYTRTRFCGLSCSSAANMAKRGDLSGSNNPRYNGGLSRRKDGRTVIVCRDWTLTLYSRAVMEAHLGRPLTSSEIVHHRNEDPTDDRIENLQILTRAEHLALHRPGFKEKRKTKAKEGTK